MKFDFLFDFGSPNAYLAELALQGVERRTGVKFDYVPVLLGGIFKATNNASPAVTLRDIKNKRDFMALETQRFLRKYGITTFNKNPFFPVNTLMLMRLAVAAKLDGEATFMRFFRAAFHHMWEEPKKMDDPAVLRQAFTASGIAIDPLLTRIQDDDVKKKLIQNTEEAVARGAFGAPTFFVGDEMFFGKDQVRDVEESIMAQRAAA